VVLLPGGSRVHAAGDGALDRATKLEAPVTVSDKFLSVKERLSALLGETISKPEPAFKLHTTPAVAHRPVARGPALLRNHHVAVLSQVDALTDAILNHVLSDTAGLLNDLQKPDVPEQIELAGAAGAGKREREADSSRSRDELPREVARSAVNELEALEQTLASRYSGPAAAKPSVAPAAPSSRFGVELQASPLREFTRAARPGPSVELCRASPGREYQPAALPLERVRAVEAYRMQFAHHCLASREAGIAHSSGGDAASLATWTIWPRLADSIALAVVESAVEEVHLAMERHVEELIQQEVGAS